MIIQSPYQFINAFRELERMRQGMDRLFQGIDGSFIEQRAAGVFPLVNVTEDKDTYYVRAELPGLKPDGLDISATGNTLSISGERKIADEGESGRYHRREREAGKFNRIISLPGEVDPNKIEAELKNGILAVQVPKAEKAKPKQITIK